MGFPYIRFVNAFLNQLKNVAQGIVGLMITEVII